MESGSGEAWWVCSALTVLLFHSTSLVGEVWAGLSSHHPAHRPDVGGLEPTQTYPLLMADPSVWVLSHVPQIAPCFSLLHEGPFLLQHFPRNYQEMAPEPRGNQLS